MRSSTKRILQRGNFRDLDDPEKSVVLVKGIVKDLIADAKKGKKPTKKELENLCRVLTISWWCTLWAVGILMKRTNVIRRLRKLLRGSDIRDEYNLVIDKITAQLDLLGGTEILRQEKYIKP